MLKSKKAGLVEQCCFPLLGTKRYQDIAVNKMLSRWDLAKAAGPHAEKAQLFVQFEYEGCMPTLVRLLLTL